MNFDNTATVIAIEIDFHIPDREMVIPFRECAIRKFKARGEPGAMWIANVNGQKIAQGRCVAPRDPVQVELFYTDFTFMLKKGDRLMLQFSKILIDPNGNAEDPKNMRDPNPSITLGMECTATLD